MRQHLYTAGLAVLALTAILVTPSLQASSQLPSAPPTPPVEPTAVKPDAQGGSLSLSAGLDYRAGVSGQSQERFLTVEIVAPEDLGIRRTTPVDLAVVLDRSGSMAARGKLDFAKAAATHLVRNMAADDVFSLVTFSTEAKVWVPASYPTSPSSLEERIREIIEGGDTNVLAGLQRAALEIAKPIGEDHVGRIILLSDGRPTAGTVEPERIVQHVRKLASRGLTVSTVGLGLDYNEDLLAQMARAGGGSYDFVADPASLGDVFVDELSRSSLVAAHAASLDVKLADGVELLEVYGWEAPTHGTTFLGSISAGQTLRWTAKIRVHGTQHETQMPVADVRLHYNDLGTGQRAMNVAEVHSDLVMDAVSAEATEQRHWSMNATYALGNHLLETSARAYDRGHIPEAQRIARRSRELFSKAANTWNEPEFEELADQASADEGAYQTLSPGSAAARRQVKQVKARAQSALLR